MPWTKLMFDENGQANPQADNGGRAAATQAADSLVAGQMKNLVSRF